VVLSAYKRDLPSDPDLIRGDPGFVVSLRAIGTMDVRRAVIQSGRKEMVLLLTIVTSTDSKRETTQKTVLVTVNISVHSASPHTGIEPISTIFEISFASTTVTL